MHAFGENLAGGGDNPSSTPEELRVHNNLLYFFANDGVHGRELWSAAATGECKLAADFHPGPISSYPSSIHFSGRYGWFSFPGKEERPMIFQLDTETGVLSEIPIPAELANYHEPLCMGEVGSRTIYRFMDTRGQAFASVEPHSLKLQFMFDLNGGDHSTLQAVLGDKLLFGFNGILYACTGTPGPPEIVRDLGTQHYLIMADKVGEVAYALAKSSETGYELLRTDGTPEGTFFIRDINPGPADSQSGQTCPAEGLLYFVADDGVHGAEPWCTDGERDNAWLLKDINPGDSTSTPHYFCPDGHKAYFVADDGAHGEEIWLSDGTPEGTRLVVDLQPGIQGSGPWSLAMYQGRLYFCAGTEQFGEEVFSTDGTPEGTRLLRDIVAGAGWSGPDNLTILGDYLFFSCNDGIHGEELWFSDGTSAGTLLFADIAQPVLNPSSSPRELTPLDPLLLFVTDDGKAGMEVWRSDGTEAGTEPLFDIAPGTESAFPANLTRVGGFVYLAAENETYGRELWVTNGVPEGTSLLADIRPGPESSNPEALASCQDRLFFKTAARGGGDQLWCVPDRASSPILLPTPAGDSCTRAFEVFDTVYFYTRAQDGAISLWSTDGTPEKTHTIITNLGTNAVWQNLSTPRVSLAASPTPVCTDAERDILAAAIVPYPAYQPACSLCVLNGTTYFAANSSCSGSELWRSDGTMSNTAQVCDAFPGRAGSSPCNLVVFKNSLYFVAEHVRDGRVLWRSEGTAQDTHAVRPLGQGFQLSPPIVREMAPCSNGLICLAPAPIQEDENDCGIGRLSASGSENYYHHLFTIRKGMDAWPHQLVIAGAHAFFTADDGVHGEELWAMDLEEFHASMVKDILLPGDLSALRK